MKRKVLVAFAALLAAFGTGALVVAAYTLTAKAELEQLVQFHKIEILRRALVIHVQSVQADLLALNTPLAPDLDAIVANVRTLEEQARECNSCHHGAPLRQRLNEIEVRIDDYKQTLSYYITARANRPLVEQLRAEAAAAGSGLLRLTEEMSAAASRRLQGATAQAAQRIRTSGWVLLGTLGTSLVLCLALGAWLARSVSRPVAQLVAATRALRRGQLGTTVAAEGGTELVELAEHFNAMSTALASSYTELQTANTRLEKEVEERRRAEARLRLDEARLTALLELSRMRDEGVEAMARFVLDRALYLTGSEAGLVALADGRGNLAQVALQEPAGAHCTGESAAAHFTPQRKASWQAPGRPGRPRVVNQLDGSGDLTRPLPERHPALVRFASVPLEEEGTVQAVLVVADKSEPYVDRDIRQLTLLLHALWQNVRGRRNEEELLRVAKLQSLGLLAGGIAHDFNNLLTGILANLSLAEQRVAPDDKLHRRLAEVEKATHRARALTQQLLTFSKGGEPVRELCDVGALVEEATLFALRGSGVRATFRIAPDLWSASVDPGQLSQTVSNLVINAKQAMGDTGSVTLTCDNVTLAQGAVADLPAGRYLRLLLADEGPGIPAQDLDRIFDPYFSTKTEGSGLGLATAHSVVHRHGGHIEVESTTGGAVFRIYLPAAAPASAMPPSPAASAETPTVPQEGPRGRILVMDDEEMIRDVLCELLGEVGFQVTAVPGGAEALEAYDAARRAGTPFDIVLMDLTIPGGLGGVEAVRRLLERDPAARAVVSSGYGQDPAMAHPERYGFVGRVHKPYRADQLIHTLEQVLTRPTREPS